MIAKLRDTKVRTKLMLLAVFMILAVLGVTILSLSFMEKVKNDSRLVAEKCLPAIVAAEELENSIASYRINEYKHITSQNPAAREEVGAELENLKTRIEADFQECEKTVSGDTDLQYLKKTREKWAEYLKAGEEIIDLSNHMQSKAATVNMKEISMPVYNEIFSGCNALIQYNKERVTFENQNADQTFLRTVVVTIAFVAVITALTVFILSFLMKSIMNPIQKIDHAVQQIANGDLDVQIEYSAENELGILAENFSKTVRRLKKYIDYIDEITYALNEIARGNLDFELKHSYSGEFEKVKAALENIASSLTETLQKIQNASIEVSTGANRAYDASQALADGASDQAENIQQVTAMMETVSNQAEENAGHAKDAIRVSEKSNQILQFGGGKMKDMLEAMENISQSAHEIQNILISIEGIASQTNMLSLNASIEAARAGEAGRGFAVIAENVGKLAVDSANSAKNTRELINRTVALVEDGNNIASDTSQALNEIIETTKESMELIEQIAEASVSQSHSLLDTNKGMEQISAIVQANVAMAQETSATGEELNTQAKVLNTLIGAFQLKR